MKTILMTGDSVTDGFWNREAAPGEGHLGYAYPAFVKSELSCRCPQQYRFIDRGIGGNRTIDLYARIRKDLIHLRPDYLSILIGVNDVWHEYDLKNGVTAEYSELYYDMILSEVKEALPETKIMLLEPFVLNGTATCPDDGHPDRWVYFQSEVALRGKITEKMAKKHGCRFVPLQKIFDGLETTAPEGWWLRDGVHPTAAGNAVIAREWIKAFEEIK